MENQGTFQENVLIKKLDENVTIAMELDICPEIVQWKMVLIAKCCVIIAIPLDTWLEIVQNLRPVASPEAVVAHDLIGKNHEILELEPMILHWGPEIKMNNCFHVKDIFLSITELLFSRKNIFHTQHIWIFTKYIMSIDNDELVYFYYAENKTRCTNVENTN